jgi:hypothetical protein
LIDWTKLTDYHNDKRKSFEEFCYQVADRLCEKTGYLTSIDDSGGGDGVEFYLTLPNGDEWGWQAKFFFPNGRLNVSNRKRKITDSLSRSLENHPRLKKWFLCTPLDFDRNEIEWFNSLQKEVTKRAPDLVLMHWDERKFNNYVSLPKFNGIRNYFFGELELNIEWFKANVNKQLQVIGTNFIPELHIDTKADLSIHSLLSDDSFKEYISQQRMKLREYIIRFEETLSDFQKEEYIDWIETKRKILAYCAQIKAIFGRLDNALNELCDWLSSGRFDLLNKSKLTSLVEEYREVVKDYSKTILEFDPARLPYTGARDSHEYQINNVRRKSSLPLEIVEEAESFLYYLAENNKKTTTNYLNIFGKASVGKTHLVCNIARERIQCNLPVILLAGKPFSTKSTIEGQILTILDIPRNYSWRDFVQSLQSAAKAYRTKIPIIIDSLDEAKSMDIWKDELQGFSCTVNALPQVVLINTCRSSYKHEIWQSVEPQNAIELHNFDLDSTERALRKYFEYYKIKCDITPVPIEQFSDPIFLRIFCDTFNPERKIEMRLYVGEFSLLQIFDKYIKRCNRAICSKLGRHWNAPIVEDAVAKIARELWKRKSRTLPLSEAVELIESKKLEDLIWIDSLTSLLVGNGLLINRDYIEGQDSVFFAYNLIGGYVIAKELLSGKQSQEIETFVKSQEFQDSLASEDYSKMHPLHEDILRCFALLFPKYDGKHLHELTDNPIAFDYAVRVLFEMSPSLIGESSKELLARLFDRAQNRKRLLELTKNTLKHVEHPLNIDFWDKHLQRLSMPQRDLCWTETIRENDQQILEELDKFENTCKSAETLVASIESRLSLEAKYFSWVLSSNVRYLRDKATRALYWYGRRFPEKLFDLTVKSLAFNDPYIPERTLAATYGVAMALQNDFKLAEFRQKILPKQARYIYELMFKENAPHATTHILMRDYARHLIEISLFHNPNLLSGKEKTRIQPPFKDGGIRTWGESEEKDKEEYRDGSGPVHMDFGNYTLGSLVKDRGNYDYENPGYKKLMANFFWRLYDLGYSHELFAEIDRQICLAHYWRSGRSDETCKTDRYGKKYSWIVFFELAGYREDNSLLDEFFTERGRIPEADIDPSFPETVPTFNMVSANLLDDRSLPLLEWIEKGNEPDLSAYMILDDINGKHGPWVLIDGYIGQSDTKAERELFIFPRGFLVKKSQAAELVEHLKKSGASYGIPEIPEDFYTYAGEIPWCKTFPENGLNELTLICGTKIERTLVRKVAKLKDGTLLGESDLLLRLLQSSSTTTAQSVNSEDFEKMLQSKEIESIDITVEEERKIPERVTYSVFVPARFYSWERYHSSVNQAGGAIVTAKELSLSFDLCSQPQTFDMYQKNSALATINTQWGEPFSRNRQYLLYLRQDLLDMYLEKNDLELIWVLWGERRFGPEDLEDLQKFYQENKLKGDFKKIVTYSVLKKQF